MNETNAVATAETVTKYLDYVLKFNDAVVGLPALPFMVLGCIIAGYMAKLIPIISDRWIPASVLVVGLLGNVAMKIPTDAGLWARAIILGMLAAAASIFIHRKWLTKWIDLDVYGNSFNTKRWVKLEDTKP